MDGATPSGAKVGGGYVRVTNNGSERDRLVATSIPIAARSEVRKGSSFDWNQLQTNGPQSRAFGGFVDAECCRVLRIARAVSRQDFDMR